MLLLTLSPLTCISTGPLQIESASFQRALAEAKLDWCHECLYFRWVGSINPVRLVLEAGKMQWHFAKVRLLHQHQHMLLTDARMRSNLKTMKRCPKGSRFHLCSAHLLLG